MRLRRAEKVIQVAQGPNDGKDGRRERPEEEHETKNQNTGQRGAKERGTETKEGYTKIRK